ncbi:MAG: hypothetical protein WKF89_04065 [Chitinophagaceae bacterium]
MKVKIIQKGQIEEGNPKGWSFDSYTNIPALAVSGKGILYFGYTVEELERLAHDATINA